SALVVLTTNLICRFLDDKPSRDYDGEYESKNRKHMAPFSDVYLDVEVANK
ncbi:hypothetical protein MKW92_017275, partial [Papaver armeniacum]